MVRFFRILKAVASASNRGSKSLRQVRGNNMFYAGVTLLFMMDPVAMMFFLVIINLVLFLPSSGDPMGVVPRERLDLWPLSAHERRALRAVSPLLNPIAWIVLALMVWKKVAWDLWAVVAGSFAAGFMGSWWVRSPRVWVPRLPGGALTQLVRKDLRQFLTALDLYCALLITIPAAYLRFTGELPADAHAPLTMLMVVTPSTMALTLFGLDGESGLTRYRLSPGRLADLRLEVGRVPAPDVGDHCPVGSGRWSRRGMPRAGRRALALDQAPDASISLAIPRQFRPWSEPGANDHGAAGLRVGLAARDDLAASLHRPVCAFCVVCRVALRSRGST